MIKKICEFWDLTLGELALIAILYAPMVMMALGGFFALIILRR